MWYAGGPFLQWDLGYATSIDGISWTKPVSDPILQHGSESFDNRLLSMSTVIVEGDEYKMWYRGQNNDGSGGIGYATSESNITQINDNSDDQFSIYPNPSNEYINLSSSLNGWYTMEISSANGQLVQKKDLSANEYEINLSAFPTGVYYITVRTEKLVLLQKIIKL